MSKGILVVSFEKILTYNKILTLSVVKEISFTIQRSIWSKEKYFIT